MKVGASKVDEFVDAVVILTTAKKSAAVNKNFFMVLKYLNINSYSKRLPKTEIVNPKHGI